MDKMKGCKLTSVFGHFESGYTKSGEMEILKEKEGEEEVGRRRKKNSQIEMIMPHLHLKANLTERGGRKDNGHQIRLDLTVNS